MSISISLHKRLIRLNDDLEISYRAFDRLYDKVGDSDFKAFVHKYYDECEMSYEAYQTLIR